MRERRRAGSVARVGGTRADLPDRLRGSGRLSSLRKLRGEIILNTLSLTGEPIGKRLVDSGLLLLSAQVVGLRLAGGRL